ncbi:hypothetical protein TRVL_00864 [Trypanosoma vivax]|nr:hypothetical protein TRVL_00864 [Trypanosoma vivax]
MHLPVHIMSTDGTLGYAFNQVIWLFVLAARLAVAMGLGMKWMIMTIRLVLFALLNIRFLIPVVWWYLLSPNIIRRVAYRSSKSTKKRNLQMLFRSIACTRRGDDTTESGDASKPDRLLESESIHQLTSTLNFADGSVMPGLPQLPLDSGRLAHEEGRDAIDCFNEALRRLQLPSVGGQCNDVVDECGADEMKPDDTLRMTFCEGDYDESDDDEDKQNLHNRAKLDIYLPVPPDSLFRFMVHKRNTPDSSLKSRKFPVVICISGGAWIVGCYLWNALLARLLSSCGYIVFCPDYRNFPQTNMEGMVLDVSDAVGWVVRNAARYNGDVTNVTLMGQSAGAHLTMMSLLSQAHLAAQQVSGGPSPSAVLYNVARYNPRASIRRYIGLSGIYDIHGLVSHFHQRGLHQEVLYQIVGGHDKLVRFSPVAYFDTQQNTLTGEVIPENLLDFMPRHMFLIHGDSDVSAPVAESAKLVVAIRRAQERRRLCKSAKPVNKLATLRGKQKESVDEVKAGDPKSELPNVDIQWVNIWRGTHTDPIVEEVLSAGRSCFVEFIRSRDGDLSHQSTSGATRNCNGTMPVPSVTVAVGSGVDEVVEPDDTIHPCAAPEDRPLLIRLASFVCPF